MVSGALLRLLLLILVQGPISMNHLKKSAPCSFGRPKEVPCAKELRPVGGEDANGWGLSGCGKRRISIFLFTNHRFNAKINPVSYRHGKDGCALFQRVLLL